MAEHPSLAMLERGDIDAFVMTDVEIDAACKILGLTPQELGEHFRVLCDRYKCVAEYDPNSRSWTARRRPKQ